MKTYEIKIDEEVFNFLKTHAEPFEDTPNSVLRKFLPLNNGASKGNKIETVQKEDLPVFHSGVPQGLSQILEVIYFVKKKRYSRTDATNKVASLRKTFPQTVIDKYCRQLNKKAFEIDKLLQDQNLNDFKMILESKFTNHRDVIRDFFKSLND
ncbi:MAG: hypothetical protein AB1306_04755 [Nitrospirota bacterium]